MFEKQRLSNKNLKEYLGVPKIIQPKIINGITPLLQKNYGGDNDCSLTSITCVINWMTDNININDIYNLVEKNAKRCGYKPNFGTFPTVIQKIYQNSLNYYKIKQKTNSAYLKNIGFNFNTIKSSINQKKPIILNIWKDGRKYYENHTVLIIGYLEINNKHLLAVYDNWYSSISYVDFDKMSPISSIVLIKNI